MTVDIIMTTYRNTQKLKKCLSTVLEKTKFIDYKIYLWANEPDEEVKKVIHDSMYVDGIQFTDRIIPIFNDNNTGSFSSNNNETAKEGTGEYILLLNDDVEIITDNWLYSMVKVLETDEKVGVVGSLLLYPDQKTIQHCGVFFSKRTNNLPFHLHYRQDVSKVSGFIAQYRYYQAVTGACLLIRREDFTTLGGLDEKYFYGFDDVQLCLDIKHKLNKNCVYCPDARLIHDEGISGSFKQHPKLKENAERLKTLNEGKYWDDEAFYLSSPSYMIYKRKG
jgi:GT2 family glycosyltransferase